MKIFTRHMMVKKQNKSAKKVNFLKRKNMCEKKYAQTMS